MRQSKYEPITRDSLSLAVIGSGSIREVLAKLGRPPRAGQYQVVQARAREFDISLPMFDQAAANKSRGFRRRIPDEEWFVSGTMRNGTSTKQKLLASGYLENRCYGEGCVVTSTWNGRKIVLQLEHIDGDRLNNVKSNLTLLCPNCHSQTETWGNNRGTTSPTIYNYCPCGKRISKRSKACSKHAAEGRKDGGRYAKASYPPPEILYQEVLASSLLSTGKKYGVSDNAVRKYLTRRGYTF